MLKLLSPRLFLSVLIFVVLQTTTLAQKTAILCKTLIDGTGRPPIADAVVVVEGTRITAVGSRGRVAYPSNATVIQADGRTILPGLIDGHVHLQDWEVPMFLPFGITTIADIHNDTAWSIAQRAPSSSALVQSAWSSSSNRTSSAWTHRFHTASV